MDNQQHEDYWKRLDDETRSDRVQRRLEISSLGYVGELPELLWEYSVEAVQLYINGNFSSVILWCAAILELILADKLINGGKGTKEVIELLSLKEKTNLCLQYKIISKEESKKINEVRELRNAIIHANAGKLAKMARKRYDDVNNNLSQVLTEFYLSNLGGEMKRQTLEYLAFTRNLCARWYGESKRGEAPL